MLVSSDEEKGKDNNNSSDLVLRESGEAVLQSQSVLDIKEQFPHAIDQDGIPIKFYSLYNKNNLHDFKVFSFCGSKSQIAHPS